MVIIGSSYFRPVKTTQVTGPTGNTGATGPTGPTGAEPTGSIGWSGGGITSSGFSAMYVTGGKLFTQFTWINKILLY